MDAFSDPTISDDDGASSGMATTQLVNQMTRLYAMLQQQIIELPGKVEDRVAQRTQNQLEAQDARMRRNLANLETTLREQLRPLESRLDYAEKDIEDLQEYNRATNSRIDAAEKAGAIFVGNNPILRNLAGQWLDAKLQPMWHSHRQLFALNMVVILSQLLFWARALGWLRWVGL